MQRARAGERSGIEQFIAAMIRQGDGLPSDDDGNAIQPDDDTPTGEITRICSFSDEPPDAYALAAARAEQEKTVTVGYRRAEPRMVTIAVPPRSVAALPAGVPQRKAPVAPALAARRGEILVEVAGWADEDVEWMIRNLRMILLKRPR